MDDTSRLRRALAIASALVITTLGFAATAEAALVPGKSQGQAQDGTQGQAQGKPHRDKADPRGGPRSPGANGQGRSEGRNKGASHGPRGNSGPPAPGSQSGGRPGDGGQGGPPEGGGGQAQPEDPAGNNGTVKITPIGEDDGIPQNTPHVPCGFDVEWYGFDEGDGIVSEVVFESWAPTAVPMTVDGPSEVFVGGDPASGAGTDSGFDGEATYTLSFDGEPHPKQGYHVKLTIHTPGSQGADTKHKVYWVQPCAEPATQPGEDDTDQPDEQGTSPEGEEEPDVLGEEETAPEEPEVLGEQETAPGEEDELEVLGVQATRGVPTAVAAGVSPAERLGSALSLLLVLLGGLATAAGIAFRRRTA